MSLRIALFGQAAFGAQTLDRLLEAGHEICGVFAPPEPKRPDALAQRARERGLPLIQRRYFQKRGGRVIPPALEEHRTLAADLNVLASFTAFLPVAIADSPRHRSLCFHPSLLPRFRGGAAMQWQIILGEAETGVSIFIPDAGVDTGDIVVQRGGVRIGPEDTTGSLFFKKLSPLGVETILEAVERIDAGTAQPTRQDESQATFQGLVEEGVAALDLGRPAPELDRLARGCDPQPGAFVRLGSEPIRLYDTHLEPEAGAAPGTVTHIGEGGLRLALDGGTLSVGRVRADRGKETAQSFCERRGIKVGQRLLSG